MSGTFAKVTDSTLPVPVLQAIGKLSHLEYTAALMPLPALQFKGVTSKVAVLLDAIKPVHRAFCNSPQAVAKLLPPAMVVPQAPEKLQWTQAESQTLKAGVPGGQTCDWADNRPVAAKAKNNTTPQRAVAG